MQAVQPHPVSYTHLDVYKRQGGLQLGQLVAAAAANVLVIIDGQLFLGAAEDAAGKILLATDLVAVHINLNVTVDVDAQRCV